MEADEVAIPGVVRTTATQWRRPVALTLVALAFGNAYLALPAWVAALGTTGLAVGLGASVVAGLISIALAFSMRSHKALGVPFTLRATRRTLFLGDGNEIQRNQLRAGSIASVLNGIFLRLEREDGRTLQLRIPSVDEGRAVLRTLRLDATQSTATFRTASRTRDQGWLAPGHWIGIFALVQFVCGVGLAASRASVFAYPLLLLSTLVLAVGAVLWPTSVTIGTDAVLLRWLGIRRAVPLRSIERIEEMIGLVRLHLTDHKTVDLRFNPYKSNDLHGALLAERIRAAMTHEREGALFDATKLDRGGRDARAWVDALRVIGEEEGTFRVAAVLPEQLWSVVEDPARPPRLRAAAAVALGSKLDDSSRERLRLVADASAEPRLRIALDAASNEDPALIANALDALVDDDPRAGKALP